METPRVEPAQANLRRAWALDEDEILQREAELQLQSGSLRDWKLIATKLPRRTNKDCRKRWSKICDSVNKGPWNRREDKMLEEAVAQVGHQWISVAKRVGTRHADQCAKRWRHFLDPDLDHSRWEQIDDARLWAAVVTHGRNWRKIVEEEFPERSPTNVKNRYAVIENLRRRGKDSPRTPATPDEAREVETSRCLFTSGPNNGGQGSTSADFSISTVSTDSPWDFEKAVFSAGALDDDFGPFLQDPLTPETRPSSTLSTRSLTDANASTNRFPSDFHCTVPGPASAMHMQHPSNTTTSSTEKHMPDVVDYGIVSSLDLEPFPQMESEVMNDIGNEQQHELLWEPQNDSDKLINCAMEGSSNNTARSQITPFSSDPAFAVGETKKVSLCLEDMQPETANMVTSILLRSNIDLKMKMTVQ